MVIACARKVEAVEKRKDGSRKEVLCSIQKLKEALSCRSWRLCMKRGYPCASFLVGGVPISNKLNLCLTLWNEFRGLQQTSEALTVGSSGWRYGTVALPIRWERHCLQQKGYSQFVD